MRSVFIILSIILYTFIFILPLQASDLDSKFYAAEGMYYNNQYSEALKSYQTLLSISDPDYPNHEKSLFRVISILKDSTSADDSSLLKTYCSKYRKDYPNGKFQSIVDKIILDSDPPSTGKVSPTPAIPFEIAKKPPVNTIDPEPPAETGFPVESLQGRFQSGFWVKYKLENFLVASIKYDQLTYAVTDAVHQGDKLKCNLIVVYEDGFEKLIMTYKVVFKDIQHYSIKDVTVKVSGKRQQSVDSNVTGEQLPIGLLTLAELKKTCKLKGKLQKTIMGKTIDCYEFDYDSGNLNMACKTVYSTQIPIMSCYYLKARNPNYTFYEFKLVDFGYTGGENFAY